MDKCVRDKPVYLNLLEFAFPITAIVSILHRISGVALFLCIPWFLTMLQNVVVLPDYYMKRFPSPLIIWFILTILILHLFAGVRHLCMDAGWGEDRPIAVSTSYLVLILTVIFSALIGWKLC